MLDCPPALDLLTLNALVAADSVLIPMQAEYFALEGVSELLDTMDRIRQSLNPALEVEGVVLTMYDERTNLAQQVTNELRNFFGDKLCSPPPSRATCAWPKLPATASRRCSMIRSKGAESYIRLAKEIMDHATRRAQPAPESSARAASRARSDAGASRHPAAARDRTASRNCRARRRWRRAERVKYFLRRGFSRMNADRV